MKKAITTSLLLALVFLASTKLNAQCVALNGTIATTSNPSEIEIDVDFNAVLNPMDYSCFVTLHNITTGINYQTNLFNQLANPSYFIVPTNGDYYAVLWSNDTLLGCWDSLNIGSLTISTAPINCGASFTSSNTTPFDYTFDAALSFTGTSTNTIYTWDFGDGNVGTGNPINHTYAVSGAYQVTLSVSDSACSGNSSAYVYVSNSPCNTVVFHNQISIEEHQFSAQTVFGYPSPGASYFWDFGDGTTATGSSVNHIYTNPAAQWFNITLITIDTMCIDTNVFSIFAGAVPPSCGATLNVTPDAPLSPGNTFEVLGSFTTTTAIEWDFGDGNSSALNPVYHLYNTTGGQNYFEAVCVVSDSTCKDSLYYQVHLGPNVQCEALFTLVQDTMNVGLYNGYNLSSVNGVATYFWDFGDSTYSYDPFPTHTYTSTGIYNVCLTVTTNNNCADSICFPLSVVIKAGTTINILDPQQNLSLAEETIASQVSIFPNPSNGNITLQIKSLLDENSFVEVVDIYGRTIYSGYHFITVGNNQINLDLAEHAKSIYFLRVNQVTKGRIILE